MKYFFFFPPPDVAAAVVLLHLMFFCNTAKAYCWEPGKNPGFKGAPVVQQLDMATVRVSWANLVTHRQCADQFLVKYWPRSNPQAYQMSDLLDNSVDFVDVTVTPKVDYQFQAVAREDKGKFVGIDYNKSPIADFKTSAYNLQLPKLPPEASIPDSGSESVQDQSIRSSSQNSPSSSSSTSGSTSGSTHQFKAKSVHDNAPATTTMSIEMMVVIVVCGLALLLILSGISYKLCIQKRLNRRIQRQDEEDEEDDDSEGPHGAVVNRIKSDRSPEQSPLKQRP